MKTVVRSGGGAWTRLWKRAVAVVGLLLLLPVAAWGGGVVTNCTEANLRAAMAGGGNVTFACDGTITLASTITNTVDTVLDGSGRQVTLSGNKAVRVFCLSTNARLTIADNGGPTLTIALLPGSPAIDAGDTAATPPIDQRGHPRPVGLAADVGAYEYGTTPRLLINSQQSGTVEIFLSDASGRTCRLLASSDLVNWQSVSTNSIAPNGTSLFQVNSASGPSHQFYRIAMP